MEITQTITPIIRWAGSKRKILPLLAGYWSPSYKRYVEPFAGSAALFFKLQPGKALIGDINQSLIETYEVLREKPDELYSAVSKVPRSERRYYKVRAQNPKQLSELTILPPGCSTPFRHSPTYATRGFAPLELRCQTYS